MTWRPVTARWERGVRRLKAYPTVDSVGSRSMKRSLNQPKRLWTIAMVIQQMVR